LSYQKKLKAMIEIKITGSGSKLEIIKSLKHIIQSLDDVSTNDVDAILDGAVWEDSTLLTEIKTV
jgi:hypothetical protein